MINCNFFCSGKLMYRNLLFIPLLFVIEAPLFASSYDALCDGSKCTVTLDAASISTSSGTIQMNRIAKWFTGGEETFSAAKGTAGGLGGALVGGVAGAVLLGPIGLLGGLIGGGLAGSKAGKSADLYFTVIGYNDEGNKTTINYNFINPKPARKMLMELPMFSGLGAGQTRSIESLKAAMRTGAVTTVDLPDKITLTETKADKSTMDASKEVPQALSKDLPDKL